MARPFFTERSALFHAKFTSGIRSKYGLRKRKGMISQYDSAISGYEAADARQIAEGLRAQFYEEAYALRTVHIWITELRRGREDLHDEPRTGRPSADNLPTKIQEL
jgi:hypothetical protein